VRIVCDAERRSALLHTFAEDNTRNRMPYSAHGLHPMGRKSDFVARDLVVANNATHIGMLHSIGGREIRQSVQGTKSFTRFMVSQKRKRSRFDIEGHSLRSSRPRCISFWFPAPPVGRRAGEMGGQSGRSKDRDGLLSLSHSPSFAALKKRLLTQRSLCGALLLMQGPRFHGAEESRKSLVERLRLEQKRSVLAVRYVVGRAGPLL
jgi:hypothetical protein